MNVGGSVVVKNSCRDKMAVEEGRATDFVGFVVYEASGGARISITFSPPFLLSTSTNIVDFLSAFLEPIATLARDETRTLRFSSRITTFVRREFKVLSSSSDLLHSIPSSNVGVGGKTNTIGKSTPTPLAVFVDDVVLRAGEGGGMRLLEEKVADVGVNASPREVGEEACVVVEEDGEVGERTGVNEPSRRGEKMEVESREARDA